MLYTQLNSSFMINLGASVDKQNIINRNFQVLFLTKYNMIEWTFKGNMFAMLLTIIQRKFVWCQKRQSYSLNVSNFILGNFCYMWNSIVLFVESICDLCLTAWLESYKYKQIRLVWKHQN
jgi:hypothetical protein